MEIKRYLEDLEARIDEEEETELFQKWINFNQGQISKPIFSPARENPSPSRVNWPEVRVNEAIADYEKMALQQFKSCSDLLEKGGGNILAVRCNYGTSIIPSLFGVELFQMEEKLDTLPTSKPLPGGKEDVKKLVKKGVPDINQKLGEKVFKMAEKFLEIMEEYPHIKKHVYLYHPDVQGPMDICEVLWGSDLFLDIMDEPGLVHDLLEIITQTYIKFMNKWQELVPVIEGDYAVHWGMVHEGKIMLRDDSAMNFSPEMFAEFIKPYDSLLLKKFGGGALHFCGRGDHYLPQASSIKELFAVHMSQPDYNDMEKIYENTIDKDIKILGLDRETAAKSLQSGRDLKGKVHCP